MIRRKQTHRLRPALPTRPALSAIVQGESVARLEFIVNFLKMRVPSFEVLVVEPDGLRCRASFRRKVGVPLRKGPCAPSGRRVIELGNRSSVEDIESQLAGLHWI